MEDLKIAIKTVWEYHGCIKIGFYPISKLNPTDLSELGYCGSDEIMISKNYLRIIDEYYKNEPLDFIVEKVTGYLQDNILPQILEALRILVMDYDDLKYMTDDENFESFKELVLKLKSGH